MTYGTNQLKLYISIICSISSLILLRGRFVSDGVVEKTEGVINHGQSRDNECEHLEHKTSDEDKQNTKQNT